MDVSTVLRKTFADATQTNVEFLAREIPSFGVSP